jgi:hypothetical protein
MNYQNFPDLGFLDRIPDREIVFPDRIPDRKISLPDRKFKIFPTSGFSTGFPTGKLLSRGRFCRDGRAGVQGNSSRLGPHCVVGGEASPGDGGGTGRVDVAPIVMQDVVDGEPEPGDVGHAKDGNAMRRQLVGGGDVRVDGTEGAEAEAAMAGQGGRSPQVLKGQGRDVRT